MSFVPQAIPTGLPVRVASPTQPLDPTVGQGYSVSRQKTAAFDDGAVGRLTERLAAVGLLDVARQAGVFDKIGPGTTMEEVKQLLVQVLSGLGVGNLLSPEELLANRSHTSEISLDSGAPRTPSSGAAGEPRVPAFDDAPRGTVGLPSFDDAPRGTVGLPSFDAPGLPAPRSERRAAAEPVVARQEQAPPPSFMPFVGGASGWGGLSSAPTQTVAPEDFGVPVALERPALAPAPPMPPPAKAPASTTPVQLAKPVSSSPVLEQAPPRDLSQRLAAIANLLDAEGRAALERIQGEGLLAATDDKGRTVLEHLEALAAGPLSERARELGYTPASVVREMVMDLDDPTQIRQDGMSDCVLTNLRLILSRDQPGQYGAFVRDLYMAGEAAVGPGATVKLQQALKPFDLGGNFGRSFYKDGQLMFDINFDQIGGGQFTIEEAIDKFLNEKHPETGVPWTDRLLAANPAFDNPFVRGLLDMAKGMWNRGERAAVAEMAKPYLSLFIDFKAGPDGEAAAYLVDNMEAAFIGGAQAAEAVPAGLPLSKVGAYFPGRSGFGPGPALGEILKANAMKGVEIPLAVKADNGDVLHLTTLVGRTSEGDYMLYDPKGGLQVFTEEELLSRTVAAFLPSSQTHNLPPISMEDSRPVGGGSFRPQRRRA